MVKSKDLEKKKKERPKKKSLFREYFEAALIAVILAIFIRTFVVQAFKIPSGSMIPTLHVGDHILVNKFIYGIRLPFVDKTIIPISKPDRGDIIVFIYPVDREKDFIKRVIGLPGEKIKIRNKKIFIDGELFDDPYGVYEKGIKRDQHLGPLEIPEDRLFVMGDNRDHSCDSRFWGFVPLDLVKGEAMIIYWSWPHWRRFGHIIN